MPGGTVTNFGQIEFELPEHREVALYQVDATVSNEQNSTLTAEVQETRRDQPMAIEFVRRGARHINTGRVLIETADVTTDATSTWTNSGSFYIGAGTDFQPGQFFAQQRDTLEVHGRLGPTSEVIVSGGELAGTGTIDANVSHQRGSISPGPGFASLRITGSLSQQSGAVTIVDVEGSTPDRDQDLIAVEKDARLDGTLRINRSGDREFTGADVLVAAEIAGRFASNNASDVELELTQSRTGVTLATDRQTPGDAESARLALEAGIDQLSTMTASLDALFDLSGNTIPLLPSEVLVFSSWSTAEGELESSFRSPTSSVQTFADLRGELADLGLQVLCMETIEACADGSLVQARLNTQTSPLNGTLDAGTVLADLLSQNGLASSLGLSGTMQLTGVLGADFTFGVDAAGFYVTGDSGLELNVDLQGGLAAAYDLPIPELAVSTSASSNAQADFQIGLSPSDPAARVRLEDLQTPATTFALPSIDGNVVVDLGLLVGKGEPTDLELTGVWTIPVVDNQVEGVQTQLDAPDPEELIAALAPIFVDSIRTVTDPIMDALESVPLPLLGGDPESLDVNPSQGLVDDIPVWFDQIASWINHKFEYITNLLFGSSSSTTTTIPGQGAFYTLGDEQLRAADLRSVTNATGRGVKIGVISDTASATGVALAQASGDLPPTCAPASTDGCLTVLNAGVFSPGDDEGIAMLEIIHDIAPEAQLFFSSGAPAGNYTPQAFAGAVAALAAAGVDIIVDDLYYTVEPYFDEAQSVIATPISQLLETTDLLYVTAAGNETLEHLQDTYRPAASPTAPAWSTGNVHNWSPTTGTDPSLVIPSVPISRTHNIYVQWSDTFLNPTQQYILTLVDPAGVPYTAAHPNAANFDTLPTRFAGPTRTGVTNFAYDQVQFRLNTATPIELAIVELAADPSKPQPVFEIFTSAALNPTNTSLFQGLCGIYTNHPACPLEDNAIFGHGAVDDVLTVGAINSVNASWVENTALNTEAPYSQQQPRDGRFCLHELQAAIGHLRESTSVRAQHFLARRVGRILLRWKSKLPEVARFHSVQ